MRRLLLLLLVLVCGAAGFVASLWLPVERSDPYRVTWFVDRGDGVREIGEELQRLGLVRDARAFTLLAALRGQARRLQAGPYEAASDQWAGAILDRMVAGDVRDTSVVVPEGLWAAEAADRFAPHVAGGREAFLAAAADSAWLAGEGVPAPRAEGFLFPDTYRVVPGDSARAVVRRMVRRWRSVWEERFAERADSLGWSAREAMTLASIVEAEAAIAAERARISAVYHNRLDRDMPLQADPTVVYALGERTARLLYDDLQVASPYNTYLVAGLPPGPIGNPGAGAIQAALWPDPDCRDLYFVARGDGSHLFGRTHEDHLANRRRVERERRAAAEDHP